MTAAVIAMLLVQATPIAETAAMPDATVAAPDPARLAEARAVIDVLMPPATREQMISAMITPMLANMRRGITQDPKMAALLGNDPKLREAFDQFMARQNARTVETMRAELPGMIAAMTNAYARRFDVAQLREIKSFFVTPTGRAYMQAAFSIMSDPDVARWQRTMMSRTMSHVQEDVAAFVGKLVATETRNRTP